MTRSTIAGLPALALRYDLRSPEFGVSAARLLAAALVQATYVESFGFERVTLSEHHHAEDGYLPSVLVAAGAFAARTREIVVRPSALILPLHDPLRVAEDLAFLDVLSSGRIEATVAAGYRRIEFDMLRIPFEGRGTRLAESVALIKRAWSGERFDHDGRSVLVRPLPIRPGGPPLIMGGSTPRAARRAAEIADGFDPSDSALITVYRDECARVGRTPGDCRTRVGAFFVHVSEDPERDMRLLEPHVRHEQAMYKAWEADTTMIGDEATTRDVWSAGTHLVLTPEDAASYLVALDPAGIFTLHPLIAGVDPDLANESLRLFCERVLPLAAAGASHPQEGDLGSLRN